MEDLFRFAFLHLRFISRSFIVILRVFVSGQSLHPYYSCSLSCAGVSLSLSLSLSVCLSLSLSLSLCSSTLKSVIALNPSPFVLVATRCSSFPVPPAADRSCSTLPDASLLFPITPAPPYSSCVFPRLNSSRPLRRAFVN